MTRVIVVRHGFSTANKSKAFAAHTDAPLTEIGKRQAECVAEYLFANERIDKIFHSGLLRTKETAEPTAKRFSLPLFEEKGLIEIFGGLWENMPYSKINTLFHEDWMRWLYDISNAGCTGGESVYAHYLRIERTVRRLAEQHDGQTIALFTHYTPVRVMRAMSMDIPPEQFHRTPLPLNASVNVFEYEQGRLIARQTDLITYPLSLSASKRLPPPPFLPHSLIE